MKKLFSLFLALVLLLCLYGCRKPVYNYENREWAPRYIDDDTYINEYAGIKFVKNNAWIFEKELDTNDEGPILNMVADNSINKVEISFVQVQSQKQDFAKEYLENMIDILPGWEFDNIIERNFCGQRYFCVNGTLGVNNYRCYTRVINDYMIRVNIFAVDIDMSDIEAMFYEIKD